MERSLRTLANASSCTDNVECPANELCYTGVPWFENGNYSTASPDTLPGCYCNTFYGFTGPLCLEASASTQVTIVWNSLSFSLGIICLVVLGVATYRLHQREKLWSSLAMFTTIVLSFVGTLMTSLWALMVALSAAVREGSPPPHWDFNDQYKGRYNAPSLVFGPIGVGISALALLHVSLTWLEITINSGRLTPHQSSRLSATKHFVYLFEVLAVAVGISGAVYEKTNGRSIFGFLLLPLILFILVSYFVGAVLLVRLLHHATDARSQLDRVSKSSQETAFTNPAMVSPGAAISPPSFLENSDSGPNEDTGNKNARASWFWASLPPRPLSKPKNKTLSTNLEGGRTRALTQESKASSVSPKLPPTSSEKLFFSVMVKVRNTVVAITLCITAFLIATVGISSVDQASDSGWKAVATPEGFPYVKAFHHLQMTSIIVSQLSIALYIFPMGGAV
ncbi:Hypothetical Protein FCC1311_015732 [Hondaea fermentalgiana]|uniref:Uncharacterized protein n=1 Tax=Hondaea fermentalgiana TaxID=2315210 RepID=A0A2R5G475_9STRA|nr:Hypothetical Protein FCC1311_015732 [Hondaea fermentalgiana]|eukprot:GBG25355.1 Hypothetical Protein FCC1311_015732 [Hondaea fermentalgiana]